jgi:hypothetical protein
MGEFKKALQISLILIFVLLLPFMFITLNNIPVIKAYNDNWLLGWTYRKSHVINPARDAGTNYQVRIKACYTGSEQNLETIIPFIDLVSTLPIPSGASVISGQAAVYWDGTYLHVWYGATNNGNPSGDNIYYIKTSDFVNWGTPVKVIDRADGIRDPTVFVEGDYIYLFCQCYDGTSYRPIRLYRIAKTADFTNSANYVYVGAPIDVGSSGQFDNSWVASPCVVKIGSTYWMAYEARTSNGIFSIGRAYTTNIEGSWTKDGQMRDGQGNIIYAPSGSTYDLVSCTFIDENTLIVHYNAGSNNYQIRYLKGSVPQNSMTMSSSDMTFGDSYTTHCAFSDVGFIDGLYTFLCCQPFGPPCLYRQSSGTVFLGQHCKTDFGDIRFTDDDGTTLLDYWIESKVDGEYAIFWVEVADDLSTNPATIYIYYGKNDATTTSNGENTFLFFDGFPGTSYDSNKWQVVGSPTITVSGGELKIQRDSYSGSWSVHGLRSKTFTADEKRLIVKMKINAFSNNYNVRADSDYYSKGQTNKVGFESSGNRIYGECDRRDAGGGDSSIVILEGALANVYYTVYTTRWGSTNFKGWLNGEYKGQITSNVNDGSTYIGVFIEEWGTHGTVIGTYDCIGVAKYADPEPSHGAWGNEETRELNNVPTISAFEAPNTVYANKCFLLNATINDLDGIMDLSSATIELQGIILKWEAESNTFSKLSDPNNYCILDSAGSFKTQLNATAYKLSWKIKLRWAYPEGSVSILPANTKVFDIHGASSGGNYVELFTFEDDLIVYSASADDYRINPAQTIKITGNLYYDGTTIPPEDVSGITAKVNLGSTLIGSTTLIGTDGTFTISFAGEQNVGQYLYTVYATTDKNTVQNQTVNVIVDKIKVQSYNVNDTRVNLNGNVNIDVLLNYDYDNMPVVDGSVTINGFTAVHQGGGFWRITQVQHAVQAVTYDTVAVSGNIYGITAVDQNGKSVTVIWDRIKVASLTASDNRTDVGSNVTLTVQLVYEYDNASVSSGNFTLNGLLLTYQSGVWITIDTKNSPTAFTYNKVEGADEDYGITVINMNEQSATVIWDRVLIILSISDERIDVGATADVTFTGTYEFDSMPFTGTITLNDTTTKNTVGKYGYKVSSIFDPVYGLTAFTTNEVYCIFDRINITKFEALDNRINVGDTTSFRVEGVYEYDSTPWIGSYELNDTAPKTIVGRYWYKIVKVTDSNYGLTVFQQTTSDAYVVFDRINVVSYGSDDARRDVNTDATFYLTLEYEYDGTPITDGIAYFNGSLPLEWSYANSRWEYKATKDSVQKLTLYLAEVTGNSYGITALNPSISNKTITVIWDQIKITDGGVTKEILTLDETVTVWFRAIYEYDGTPFTGNNGTLYLNGTRMTWSSTNARWEYTYTTNIVGTVTFKISAVLDSSQNLTTINDAAGAKTITIWSMPFSIISNSIITELYFNSSSKIITFKISGQDGTTGYINITIAKTLIEDVSELKIYLDDEPINYTLSYTNNFWLIHFTYHHSTHKVVIHLGSTSATKPIETYANPLTAYDIGIVTLAIFTAMKLGEKKQNRKSAKTI